MRASEKLRPGVLNISQPLLLRDFPITNPIDFSRLIDDLYVFTCFESGAAHFGESCVDSP